MALPKRPGIDRFLKMVGVSLVIHIALVVFLNFNPWPMIIKVRPTAYTVTLMPVSLREPEIPKTNIPPVLREEIRKPIEKTKPLEKPKKDDIVEKVRKKERDKESLKRLQEALDEVRKKVALDQIQKKVARREQVEEKLPIVPSDKSPSPLKPELKSIYSKIVESKIKEVWTIPENLVKEIVDLEATIVIIIDKNGRVQKFWFEKKSGNSLYDQSAMRAIKKAEPLPPIPKELSEDTLEFEIHFTPDSIR